MRKNHKSLLSPEYHEFMEALFETSQLILSIIAISIIISFVSSNSFSPKWIADGWPSFHHYPKNIELRAVALILMSIPLISFAFHLIKSKLTKLFVTLPLSLVGLVMISAQISLYRPILWIIHFATIIVLVSFVYHFFNCLIDRECERPARFSIFITIIVCVIWMSYISVIISKNYTPIIDAHHHGEVFTSATDLIEGGKPFVTYFWPHGFSDTGITALFFKIMARNDFPTMMIAKAFFLSLSIPTILLLSYGMQLGYFALLILGVMLLFNSSSLILADLVFVSLSFFIYSKAKRWYQFIFSGVLIFIAHIYRIDTGIYGFMAVILLSFYLITVSIIHNREILKDRILQLFLFTGGVLSSAIFIYSVFGWPSHEWYHVVFGIFAKYLTDSTGFPFPLPLSGSQNYQFLLSRNLLRYAPDAVYPVITVFAMFAIACKYIYTNSKKATSLDIFSLLLIIYSVLSLRSAFSRSDLPHIYWFAGIIYFIIALFFARVIVSSSLLNKWSQIIIISIFFAFFNFSTGIFYNKPWHALTTISQADMSFLRDYMSKKPKQCSHDLFSTLQLEVNSHYDKDVCVTKKYLEANHIGQRQLLISHSAALLYPSLGYKLPTKYYCLGWAITEEMQKDLIAELEESNVSAVLFADKYMSMNEYDIPDKDRLPVYYKWLDKRFDLSAPIKTPLGEIVFKKGDKVSFPMNDCP